MVAFYSRSERASKVKLGSNLKEDSLLDILEIGKVECSDLVNKRWKFVIISEVKGLEEEIQLFNCTSRLIVG